MLQLQISFLIFPLMLLVLSVSGTNSNIYFQCSKLDFDLTTPYELNVNSLCATIIDSASVSNFNTFEVFLPGNSQSNAIYGLFQCQGDLNSKCKDCVASSISQLRKFCPVSIGGTIQLEGCLVKYDNTSFFGVGDRTGMMKCGPSIAYSSELLNSIDNTLENLVGGNGQYFRKGDFGSIRGVAQCVQDLSVSDCQDCLSETSGRLKLECERSRFWLGLFIIQDRTGLNRTEPNRTKNRTIRKTRTKDWTGPTTYGSVSVRFHFDPFGSGHKADPKNMPAKY